MTKFFRFVADTFFAKRYGHRAVVLETIAGVPGMVAGMLIHLRSLRKMQTGYGRQIREMLAEAENERMHLMFFIEIAKPNYFERFIVLFASYHKHIVEKHIVYLYQIFNSNFCSKNIFIIYSFPTCIHMIFASKMYKKF